MFEQFFIREWDEVMSGVKPGRGQDEEGDSGGVFAEDSGKRRLVGAWGFSRRWRMALLVVSVGLVVASGMMGWQWWRVRRAVEVARELRAEGLLQDAFLSLPDRPSFLIPYLRWRVWLPASMMPHPDFAIRSVGDYKGVFGSKVAYQKLLAFPSLTHLHLERVAVTEEMVDVLVRCRALKGLTIDKSELTDVELKRLTRLKQLTRLELSVLRITEEGLKAFGEFPRLEGLSFDAAAIQETGGLETAFEPMANRLRLTFLNLQGKGFQDRHMDVFVKAFRERPLAQIILSTSEVTDAGVRFLAEMKNVRTLSFYSVKIGDEGLMALTKMRALKQLDLFGTAISGAGVVAFRKARPEVVVQLDGGLRKRWGSKDE